MRVVRFLFNLSFRGLELVPFRFLSEMEVEPRTGLHAPTEKDTIDVMVKVREAWELVSQAEPEVLAFSAKVKELSAKLAIERDSDRRKALRKFIASYKAEVVKLVNRRNESLELLKRMVQAKNYEVVASYKLPGFGFYESLGLDGDAVYV